jgi:3-oxoadipyl-CoA thiolase
VRADDLGAFPIKALMDRNPDLDPAAIEEVFYGCANQPGEDNRNVARMNLLLAGLPPTVPGVTLNRPCASGLETVRAAARAIRSGDMGLAIAGGVESMTRAPFVMGKAGVPFDRHHKLEDTTMGRRFINPALDALYGTDTMPRTAEILAETFHVTRSDQDAFALRSQQRAIAAQDSGFLADEIIVVEIADKRGKPAKIVSADEHPHADTSLEKPAELKPLFGADGTVTAGNSSGINDGAAALIIAGEAAIRRTGCSRERGFWEWPQPGSSPVSWGSARSRRAEN